MIEKDQPEPSSARTPREEKAPRSEPPPAGSAGLPAVASALHHAWEEMGVVRGARALLNINKKEGYDCQSCAWPNPDGERHVAEFCENGAKAAADEATTRRIGSELFEQWSLAALAERSDHWLGKQGRITEPLLLDDGATHYRPVDWTEAFGIIAAELNGLASPDEAVFYTSGRTSNEAAFLYQLFVRQFGTNNLPDCSNMCHESSGAALGETIGIGKGTVTLRDFELADAIFVVGQNPGTNHPRMLSALQGAKRRGARIVSINPLREAGLMRFRNPQEVVSILTGGTELADLFLQVRINGDAAALQGLAKLLFEEEQRRPGEVLDGDFITSRTTGLEAYRRQIDSVTWETITGESGLTVDELRRAAAILSESKRVIFCWAMGLTQHRNSVATIQEIVNLQLLRGQVGRPGAGLCPVRGHSNVQGDRTMGIWERPKASFLDALERTFDFAPPREAGLNTVEAIEAMHEGRAKVFFALGGNFLSATPDTDYTAEALRRCRLTVQVSTKLNRAHLVTGRRALILPCIGRSEIDRQEKGEQFVTVEDSMGIISASRGIFEPASEELRSEPWIVASMARAVLGDRTAVDWEALAADYDRIRDLIEKVVPGFDDFNRRIRQGPFYLPNGPREGRFPTADGRAHFTSHAITPSPLPAGHLMMMTIRSHDQFNTTIYGLEDRYRGIHGGRRVILINEDDMSERGLKSGDAVDITSHFNGETRKVERFFVVPYDIPRRCAATYFPEANPLVPVKSYAEKSFTPTSKSVVITIEKSRE